MDIKTFAIQDEYIPCECLIGISCLIGNINSAYPADSEHAPLVHGPCNSLGILLSDLLDRILEVVHNHKGCGNCNPDKQTDVSRGDLDEDVPFD